MFSFRYKKRYIQCSFLDFKASGEASSPKIVLSVHPSFEFQIFYSLPLMGRNLNSDSKNW
jgi:hypothetical protein